VDAARGFGHQTGPTNLIAGATYTVVTPGSMDWTAVGSQSNAKGTRFTAVCGTVDEAGRCVGVAGIGTGTATHIPCAYGVNPSEAKLNSAGTCCICKSTAIDSVFFKDVSDIADPTNGDFLRSALLSQRCL
jgi:hypothetical protein